MSQEIQPRQNRIREVLDRIYDQHPPQVKEYLRRYREDPKSRAFAPLAEAYRRDGRVDDAIEICLDGIANHPNFYGGRVALAKCYMDKQMYGEAREQLDRVVQAVPENLLAQRLLGDALFALGQARQAVHCYKMALILSPHDVQLEARVRQIETGLDTDTALSESRPDVTATVVIDKPESDVSGSAPTHARQIAEDGNEKLWALETQSEESMPVGGLGPQTPMDQMSWNAEESDLEMGSERIDSFLKSMPESHAVGADADGFQVEHIGNVFQQTTTSQELTTATLAELYFSQEQYEKSLRIFEQIAQKNPLDARIRGRIEECRLRMGVSRARLERQRKAERLKNILFRLKRTEWNIQKNS
jgi:tetratricopeptide (TPR) repeat protein